MCLASFSLVVPISVQCVDAWSLPSPMSLFHLLHDVVDACASANFLVGNVLFLLDFETWEKIASLKTSEVTLDLLIGSPVF